MNDEILENQKRLASAIEQEIKKVINDAMSEDFYDFVDQLLKVTKDYQIVKIFSPEFLKLLKDYRGLADAIQG